MFSLEEYSDQELLSILQCNKLHGLYDLLDESKANDITQIIQNQPPIQTIPNKLAQALLFPLTDTSSVPFILLGGIFGIVGGGIIPFFSLFACTAIILSASLAVLGYFCYANIKEIQVKENKINRLLHLYELKNQVANVFLKRRGLAIEIFEQPSYSDKHELTITKNALRACMVISTSLFCTYFLGLKGIFIAFGISLFSTALGPLGLFIGIGFALGVGIYFGYRHYQMLKQDDYFKFEQKFQSAIVGKKTSICQKISANGLKEMRVGEMQKTKPVYSTKKSHDHNVFTFKLNRLTLFQSAEEPVGGVPSCGMRM